MSTYEMQLRFTKLVPGVVMGQPLDQALLLIERYILDADAHIDRLHELGDKLAEYAEHGGDVEPQLLAAEWRKARS